MGFILSLRLVGKVCFRISTILICLISSVSCAFSGPTVRESPADSQTPDATNSLPTQTLTTPLIVTLVPTTFDTPGLTPTLQITPETVNSTPVEIMDPSTQYDLDVIFDYFQHSLTVSETISYMNNTPQALSELLLVVEANRIQGGFVLESLTWEAGAPVENYKLDHDQLHISMPQPLSPGEGIKLLIRFSMQIPEIPPPSATSRPIPYGYTGRQTNIVDWYAYIPPYRVGEGWLVNQNWWFGEHQVFDIADFQVKLTLAEPVADLVIAASAPAEQDGDTYNYHLENARSFALSASNEYQVQSSRIGDVTIYSYSFPVDHDAGGQVLQDTADALELFNQLVAPYPHTSLSVVEADFLDGMEYSGLYFLSNGFYNLYDGTPKGYLTIIAAHETAHQWWYGLVGNDQALEPWLDEALCTYMEIIFYENIYPDNPSDNNQSFVDWWWYYRVNFYAPGGWVDEAIYDFDSFRSYRDSVYLNGAEFLDQLRTLIGDQAFFSFLRDYADQKQGQVATATDFFSILKQNTSIDIDALVAEYFQAAK